MKQIIIILLCVCFLGLHAENLKVHFIDIAQGDAILLQYGGQNYLIDAGKNRSDDKLITYLQAADVDTIHAALLSHPDYDHYGEFEDLIESSITIKRFVKNSDFKDNSSFNALMALLTEQEIPVDVIDANSDLNWAVTTDVLSPDPSQDFDSDDYNNRSIVIKLQFGDIDFLFTGDAEEECNTFLAEHYNLDADVLKVSHHGAPNGTSQAFVQAVSPAVSVLCSGNNGYGHPAQNVIGWLQQSGSQIFSTADDYNTWDGNGSDDVTVDDDIVLETDGHSIWVNNQLVFADHSDLQLQQGWNLISLPYFLETGIAELFPHANVVWNYDADSGWTNPTILQPGKGYWVKNTVSETISFTGTIVSEINIELQQGWNLIGSIPNTILPPNNSIQIVWSYNLTGWHNYPQQESLLPTGYGYWVKALDDCVLVFNDNTAKIKEPKNRTH